MRTALFWPARRDDGVGAKRYAIRPCGIAAADFAAKNSPPDCFLNAAHPLRVRIPPNEKESTDLTVSALFFGPPGGIRTPGLWNRNPLRYPASPRAVMGACQSAYYCTTKQSALQEVFYQSIKNAAPAVVRGGARYTESLVLLRERLAVGALILFGITLMRADLNAVETAVVLAVTVVHTGRHGAADAVIGFIHGTISFLPDWSVDQSQYCRKERYLYAAKLGNSPESITGLFPFCQ